MIEIQSRIQRAAESILENEALTADLDDAAAKLLLDWGVTLSQQIAIQTIEMDESQAEESMYGPMRALRKMLRGANNWAIAPGEKNLRRILETAPMVFAGYTDPSDEELKAFIAQTPLTKPERLIGLQRFLEGNRGEHPGEGKQLEKPDTNSISQDVKLHKKID